MNNGELYINGKLIDAGGDLGVRLNRKVIDPGALNTVNAQYSYSISLPWTKSNAEALGYANVEETRNKFNNVFTAEYIMGSIRVFQGLFRLTNITDTNFKGNLYIPVAKTVQDIFGDLTMTQNAPFLLSFTDFATSVNAYNNAAATTPQAAIFPYVMYGLLPKVPINIATNEYSARNLWDDSVRIGIADIPPAINPLIMLKHIFNTNGYILQGTAFQDRKLTQLYQTYKNDPDFVQPWNYGKYAHIHVNGEWSNWTNKRDPAGLTDYEGGASTGPGTDYVVDLLDATNTKFVVQADPGGNVLNRIIPDTAGRGWLSGQIRIPIAGYYKVNLNASIHADTTALEPVTDPDTGIVYISAGSDNARADMTNTLFEIRLQRDNVQGDFQLTNAHTDGSFYLPNQPQNDTFDADNVPKYFPQVDSDGQINFVDKATDENIVCGFTFGQTKPNFLNPRDTTNVYAQVLAAKPALSYDNSENSNPPFRLAIDAPGYWKYGQLGTFDDPTEDPDKDIDYSAGTRVDGKILDANGNPDTPPGGNLDVRLDGFYLSDTTGFQVVDAAWTASDFIKLSEYTDITFSGEATTKNAAVVAYYDVNKNYIGNQLDAAGGGGTYTDVALVPITGSVYVRFSVLLAGTPVLDIEAGSATSVNVILNRFELERYYTYTIDAGTTAYTGNAYLFNGPTDVAPVLVAPFIGGVATFDTAQTALIDFDPYVTFYLTTAAFDVDGTLVLNRNFDNTSAAVIGWELSNKYKIQLENAPVNFAKRGQYADVSADSNNNAQGSANAVVWFAAGELLTVSVVSSQGHWRSDFYRDVPGFVRQNLLFDLEVTPFRNDAAWLQVNTAGDGTGVMNWDDASNFDVDTIDLVGFLDAGTKIDDYIDNFCKTFNLGLSQIDAQTFSLDVKQSKTATSNVYVDLDQIASIAQRENTPLGLPSQYVLGFTIDTDEEGYAETGENGGGTYNTGATDVNVVTQTTTFSYNWYKAITKVETSGNITINLPIVCKSEAFDVSTSYPDAMEKRYTDQAQRFMYYGGILPGTYAYNGASLQLANVRNDLPGLSILNYKNQLYTILQNYFTLLINGESDYTNIDALLTAIQYTQLDGSRFVRFNGDLYYSAELAAYDPQGVNQTSIKLIRKI